MNNKPVTFIAGVLAGIVAASTPSFFSKPTQRGTTLSLVHVTTNFRPLPDGGTDNNYRACGYEERTLADGGSVRVSEPCWVSTLPPAIAEELARAALSHGTPLLSE